MKKLILIISLFVSAVGFAGGGSSNYCENCYNSPHYPPQGHNHYPPQAPIIIYEQPYVVSDEAEAMCITKLSQCREWQVGSDFYYSFSYGYKENRVKIFSNGKTVRYLHRGTETASGELDGKALKSSNANAAVKITDDKIVDEKTSVGRSCKEEQEVWNATYEFCSR
jgi:hypothetical protein